MKELRIQLIPFQCPLKDNYLDLSRLILDRCEEKGIYILKRNSAFSQYTSKIISANQSAKMEVVSSKLKPDDHERIIKERMQPKHGSENIFTPQLLERALLSGPTHSELMSQTYNQDSTNLTNSKLQRRDSSDPLVIQFITSSTLPEGKESYGMINDHHVILKQVLSNQNELNENKMNPNFKMLLRDMAKKFIADSGKILEGRDDMSSVSLDGNPKILNIDSIPIGARPTLTDSLGPKSKKKDNNIKLQSMPDNEFPSTCAANGNLSLSTNEGIPWLGPFTSEPTFTLPTTDESVPDQYETSRPMLKSMGELVLRHETNPKTNESKHTNNKKRLLAPTIYLPKRQKMTPKLKSPIVSIVQTENKKETSILRTSDHEGRTSVSNAELNILLLKYHKQVLKENRALRVAQSVTLPLRQVEVFDVGTQTDIMSLIQPGRMTETKIVELRIDRSPPTSTVQVEGETEDLPDAELVTEESPALANSQTLIDLREKLVGVILENSFQSFFEGFEDQSEEKKKSILHRSFTLQTADLPQDLLDDNLNTSRNFVSEKATPVNFEKRKRPRKLSVTKSKGVVSEQFIPHENGLGQFLGWESASSQSTAGKKTPKRRKKTFHEEADSHE